MKSRMLIGLCGRKGSGKDTVAGILAEQHGFLPHALATPLKRVCAELFDFTDDQLWGESREVLDERYGKTPRELMQRLGTDFVRKELSMDFWLDRFQSWYELNSSVPRIVVSDVRFQNEINFIKRLGGTIYEVRRSQADRSDPHVSKRVELLEGIDAVINNDSSLKDLEKSVAERIFGRIPQPFP